jgi:hypothetical protein
LSIIAVRMSSESLSAYNKGDVSCPSSCSGDDECRCYSSYTGIVKPDDVDNLSKNEKFKMLKSAWKIIATVSVGGSDYVKFQDTYEIDGMKHNNVFIPLHTKGPDATNEAMDNNKLDLLNSLMLKTILFPGNIGVMLSGAAPNDPLFWVMHPIFDKAAHALRLSENYNTEGFDWNNKKDYMKYNGITPFTRLDLEPYLGGDVSDAKNYMTNSELWENLYPTADAVYYVYDQFTKWGDCDFDPFEVPSDD